MCHRRLPDGSKFPALVWAGDSRGDYACEGAACILELSVPAAQFCSKTKTTLKSKAY